MTFEVQARRLVRRQGVVVSDDTDHASAERLTDARRVAQTFTDNGYTAWIFRVEQGPQASAVYRMVEVLRPAGRDHNRG